MGDERREGEGERLIGNLLVTNPRSYRNSSPAHATGKAAHVVVALPSAAISHGDGSRCTVAVEGGAEHTDGRIPLIHGGTSRIVEINAIGVELVRGRTQVALGFRLPQGGGQVGGLVLRGVGAIARRRLDVDGGGCLGHDAERAGLLRAIGKQGKTAVAGVLEQ